VDGNKKINQSANTKPILDSLSSNKVVGETSKDVLNPWSIWIIEIIIQTEGDRVYIGRIEDKDKR
jgi:hypothetical protein